MICTSTSWQIFLASNEGWTNDKEELFLYPLRDEHWRKSTNDNEGNYFSHGHRRKSTSDIECVKYYQLTALIFQMSKFVDWDRWLSI